MNKQTLIDEVIGCKLSLSWFGVTKTLDETETEQAAAPFGAAASMLRASKRLIDTKHEAYKALVKVRNKIRKFWVDRTLPYVEKGARLLPNDDIDFFNERIVELKGNLAFAARELNNHFQSIKDDARQALGDLYDPEDYPAAIDTHFDVSWSLFAIKPPDYLMRLNPKIYEQECERVKRQMDEVASKTEAWLLAELNSLVGRLASQLNKPVGEKMRLKEASVEGFRTFFEKFKRLNVSSDSTLSEMVSQTEKALLGVDAGILRQSDTIKTDVLNSLNAIGSQLGALVESVPRRKLIRNPEAA